MITGFNSEAKFRDITYHIQTEDRGVKVARIDTIIYKSGGAIVYKKQIYYKDILGSDCLEQAVREIMEDIHQKTINEVKKGLWTLPPEAVPDDSFRDVLSQYLLTNSKLNNLK